MLLLCVFVFVCVSICHMCVGTWEGQKCLIPRGLWVNQHEFWVTNHVFFHQVFAVHMLGHTLVPRILAFYKVTQGETLECHILNVIFHFMESMLDRRDRGTSGENINEGSEKRNMISCIFLINFVERSNRGQNEKHKEPEIFSLNVLTSWNFWKVKVLTIDWERNTGEKLRILLSMSA